MWRKSLFKQEKKTLSDSRSIRWYFVCGAKSVLCTKLEPKLAAVFNAVFFFFLVRLMVKWKVILDVGGKNFFFAYSIIEMPEDLLRTNAIAILTVMRDVRSLCRASSYSVVLEKKWCIFIIEILLRPVGNLFCTIHKVLIIFTRHIESNSSRDKYRGQRLSVREIVRSKDSAHNIKWDKTC